MSGIIPIPTTRVADLFVRQRLTSQIQNDQLDLFRLQHQISTGKRIQLPSDDAPAALRAINLQRLLDRKGQIRTNLQASGQYLSGADSRLAAVSTSLIELRANVVGVAGNTSTDSARNAIARDIDALLQELVSAGNAELQGRYLFAGSRSQSPAFGFKNDQFVEYLGNEGSLRSYVDLERLFDTNLAGTDVFGGISAAIEGTVDLQPQITANTLVSTLNGGAGIGANPAISFASNDGTTTVKRVIDLRGAVTVGDVARLIEAGAPPDAHVRVEITGGRLRIQSDGDLINISEVAEGRTARMLGVLSNPNTMPTNIVEGVNPNPSVLKTTKLSDLLGAKASGSLQSIGLNNDIAIRAAQNGANYNGLTVQFVGGAAAGNEVATYNSGANTLTVQIEDGVSTARQAIAAINAEGHFVAQVDYHDSSSTTQGGTETLETGTFINVTAGGDGDALDTQSGLHLTNGGQSVTIDLSDAQTVEDLLNRINGANIGMLAEINAAGNGINVRSRLSGADFMIGENGGTTATQLGLRTFTADTKLAALNRGVGIPTSSSLEMLDISKLDDLQIVARNGAVLNVDLTGATTLQDVAQLINNAAGNTGATQVLARMTGGGNGLELVDTSTGGSGHLQVVALPGTQAAEYLGFVPTGAAQFTSDTAGPGGSDVITGKTLLRNDLVITARNGTQLSVDLAGATTVEDVINRINSNADNSPQVITARLARVGNGIELVDSSTGAGALSVQTTEGSLAAQYLGFVAAGQTQSDPNAVQVEGGNLVLKSADTNTLETESVFNTLIRLRTALETNNTDEIGRSLERLDNDLDRLNFARAEIGIRLQNLDVIDVRLADENVQLQAALSQDIDVDLVEAISQLMGRQYALEASLRSSASLMQMSLLNFL